MVAKISAIRKKKKGNDTLTLGIVVLIIAGAVGLLFFQNIVMLQKRSVLEQEAERLQEELDGIEASREDMEQIAQERGSEEYMERILREQGIYKKEGEEVITILLPDPIEAEKQEEEDVQRAWWNPFTW